MKPLAAWVIGIWLFLPPISDATSIAFTLQDRVDASEVVAEVEVTKIRQYQDDYLALPEAELQCRVLRSYKGDEKRKLIVYVHILNKDVKYAGNRFLLFAFRLNGQLRAFDGQRGLVTWGSPFFDYTNTKDPKTNKLYRELSFDELLAEIQRLCKGEENSAKNEDKE